MLDRNELQEIRQKAEREMDECTSPYWKNALVQLANAADRLDAMIARSTEDVEGSSEKKCECSCNSEVEEIHSLRPSHVYAIRKSGQEGYRCGPYNSLNTALACEGEQDWVIERISKNGNSEILYVWYEAGPNTIGDYSRWVEFVNNTEKRKS